MPKTTRQVTCITTQAVSLSISTRRTKGAIVAPCSSRTCRTTAQVLSVSMGKVGSKIARLARIRVEKVCITLLERGETC